MRRILTVAVVLAAVPALAQQTFRLDDLPTNDPVFIPVPSQNTDGSGGGLFREIEPIDAPRRAAAPEGGFIDRAFGMRPDGIESGNLEPIPRDGGFSPDWFADGEDEETAGGETFEEEGTGRRRFKEAPAKSARLFGPNMPSALPQVQTVEAEGGAIRKLDKMTGSTETLEIRAGETVEIGRLTVTLDACRRPAAEGQQGTMAHLRIWDARKSDSEPVFAGWMFAESPALSALDHPRYDLWVVSCSETTAEVPQPNTEG